MRIAAIRLFDYDDPFTIGYHSSHLLRSCANSVVIALCFDNGLIGYGESAPRPYVTGETTASVKELFSQAVTPFLLGQEVESLEDVERLLKELHRECRQSGFLAIQSALGAVDIALFDALGKQQQVSVASLLGPTIRTQLDWSLAVPMLPEEVIRQFYGKMNQVTFGSVKVLVNGDLAQNEARVKLIRELLGDEMEIRLEVNGHWTRTEAHANLKRLREYGLSAVEQPVGQRDIEGLREIRETFGIPVIADESMCTAEEAEALIDQGACDILNIKISKVGGLLAASQIAARAAARGIPCLLGSHVGETSVLTSAALHFLVTAPNLLLVEGFSSLLFGGISKINDLDPKKLIEQFRAGHGLGFDPGETFLRNRVPEALPLAVS